MECREQAPLRGASQDDLVGDFQRRCASSPYLDAGQRLRLRDAVLHEAGGLTYDHVEQEFGKLARMLSWPATATLKDFRHLFCTTLGNTPMPEGYRRYLMGQSPGTAAAVAYTHLTQLRQQYENAVVCEWSPLIEAINQQLKVH